MTFASSNTSIASISLEDGFIPFETNSWDAPQILNPFYVSPAYSGVTFLLYAYYQGYDNSPIAPALYPAAFVYVESLVKVTVAPGSVAVVGQAPVTVYLELRKSLGVSFTLSLKQDFYLDSASNDVVFSAKDPVGTIKTAAVMFTSLASPDTLPQPLVPLNSDILSSDGSLNNRQLYNLVQLPVFALGGLAVISSPWYVLND